MAKSANNTEAPERRIVTAQSKPAHLATKGGAGRSRKPTEFDSMVSEWYESGEWVKIEAAGDTPEAQLEDLEQVFKAVNKAAAYHNLGVDRLREDNPEDPHFESYGVWVHVRARQSKRGPEKGSIKDPVTGKRIGPSVETGRYQELLEMREAGEL